MATVRFSDELKRVIQSKAEQLFKDRIEKAEQNFPRDWGDRIYDGMFRDDKANTYALPKGFMCTSKSITFSGFQGAAWDRKRNIAVAVGFVVEMRFPNTMDDLPRHGVADKGWSSSYFLNADDSRWDDLKPEYKTYIDAIHKIRASKTVFVEGVVKVITTYTTLAPALKAWPALWDLLPENTKEKHREIKQRTKTTAKEVAENIDLNSLTGIVAADKLTK